jgi:hypothetical protein
MNKLITIPLGIMVILSVLGLLGMGTVGSPDTISIGGDSETVYYDLNGLAKCYMNGTGVNEEGNIIRHILTNTACWDNATLIYTYQLYFDTNAAQPIKWEQVGQPNPNNQGVLTDFDDEFLGLWAMIAGFAVLVGVVGLRVFGSGISEASVNSLISLAIYTALWLIFAVLSFPLVSEIELLGSLSWFVLTVLYTVGVLQTLGSGTPSGDT